MLIRPLPVVAAMGGLAALFVWTVGAAEPDAPLPVAPPIVVTRAFEKTTDHVRRNEIPSQLFARYGIEGRELYQLLEVAKDGGLDARRIRPELAFTFRRAVGDPVAEEVRVRLRDDATLSLRRDTLGVWHSESEPIAWIVSLERVDGIIESSLNASIHDAIPDETLSFGQRDRLIWNVAEAVYGWVIDFTRDIRPGDRFQILYERLESAAGDVRYGRVAAARVETQGRRNTAYVMTDRHGNNVYYDVEGRSLHRAFLKYPVQFRRISSVFNRRRFHPVLKRYRAHLGYDFAADIGTPIRATGDGSVIRAGRNGSYGIMVGIRHPKGMETRYAHMSRVAPGIRAGVRVTQGQTIGYVGMSGLANGPHVHYEFLKSGRHINYRNVDLGDGEPIAPGLRAQFDSVRVAYDQIFDIRPTHIPLMIGGE